jgi:hypothetical protein
MGSFMAHLATTPARVETGSQWAETGASPPARAAERGGVKAETLTGLVLAPRQGKAEKAVRGK